MNRFDIINRRVLANIPTFSGFIGSVVEDELKQFIIQCDYIFESLNGSVYDADIFLSVVKDRLYGDSHKLIIRKDVNTFAEFKALLRSKYSNKTMAEMNQEFYNCVQGHQESTRIFFSRLMGYWQERKKFLLNKFPENKGDLISNQELEAINVFKRGTSNSGLRQHLLINPIVSLADLKEVACSYEEAERQLGAGYVREKSFANANAVRDNLRYSNSFSIRKLDCKNFNNQDFAIPAMFSKSEIEINERCPQTCLDNIEKTREKFIQFVPQLDSDIKQIKPVLALPNSDQEQISLASKEEENDTEQILNQENFKPPCFEYSKLNSMHEPLSTLDIAKKKRLQFRKSNLLPCTTCHKCFITSTHLKEHIWVHRAKEILTVGNAELFSLLPDDMTCERTTVRNKATRLENGPGFSLKNKRPQAKTVHFRSCHICKKCFFRFSHLKEHIQVHSISANLASRQLYDCPIPDIAVFCENPQLEGTSTQIYVDNFKNSEQARDGDIALPYVYKPKQMVEYVLKFKWKASILVICFRLVHSVFLLTIEQRVIWYENSSPRARVVLHLNGVRLLYE